MRSSCQEAPPLRRRERGRTVESEPVASTLTLREVELLSDELSALAEPHRLLILRHLRRGRRTVGFLARACGMTQPLTSHHLNVLLEAGLVTRERRGPLPRYAAHPPRGRGGPPPPAPPPTHGGSGRPPAGWAGSPAPKGRSPKRPSASPTTRADGSG